MWLKSWSIQDLQITVIRIQQGILDCNPVVHIHYLLFWEILLTNKQTNKQTKKETKIFSTQRFELSTLAFLTQCSYRLSYGAVLIWLLLSEYYYQITIIRLTKNFGHTEVRTVDARVFSTMLLPTELWGRSALITLVRLLLSDYYYPGPDWNLDPKIRPVVHEKQLSGSQIRISIRIRPNFELGLPMIIASLLTKFHQNPTSSFWELLLTNKQTNKQTDTRRWLQHPAFRGIKTHKFL